MVTVLAPEVEIEPMTQVLLVKKPGAGPEQATKAVFAPSAVALPETHGEVTY